MKYRWLTLAALLCLTLAFAAAARAQTPSMLVLPDTMTVIPEQAFDGDKSIRRVVLPDGVREIGPRAFADSGLTEINLPDSIQSIDDTAFEGVTGLNVSATRGSAMYEWAFARGYIASGLKVSAAADTDVAIDGANVTVSAFVSGALSSDIRFRWQSSLDGASWSDVAEGGDSDALRFTASRAACARQYRCVVSDAYGEYPSNAVSVGLTLRVILISGSPVPKQDEQLTFRVEAEDTDDFQWQISQDSGATWTDTNLLGSETSTLSLFADLENSDCRYRCKVVSANGAVYYSSSIDFSPRPIESITISQKKLALYLGQTATLTATILPMEAWIIEPTWSSSDPSVATVVNGVVTAVGAGTAYIKITTYDEKFSAQCEVTVERQYTALLVSEENFYWTQNKNSKKVEKTTRNGVDVQNMAAMLNGVWTPDGTKYTVKTGKDTNKARLQGLIESAYADATDQSVSLFFIATHGIMQENTSAGALAMAGFSEEDPTEYVQLSELRDWLVQVPGKVIVFLQSCSAGSAIYANGEPADALFTAADVEAFNKCAIDVFKKGDPGLPVSEGPYAANTGEFRQDKFIVLAASAYSQASWGIEKDQNDKESYNFFTKWLIDGVGHSGNMPADLLYDGNLDGTVDLYELYRYISNVGDKRTFDYEGKTYTQQVQVYPENYRYALFQ